MQSRPDPVRRLPGESLGGGGQVKSTGCLILYNIWRGDEDSWQGWGWMSTSK